MRYKLGDLTKIYTGKLNANAATPDGKYPFFTCSKEVSRINTYSYDCECILVAGNGDLNVKYFHGKFNAYQRTYIIENKRNEIIYMPYLYYFMSYYIDKLRNQTIGGVIKYIKLSNLTDIVIELPTMDVQRKIVEKLKKLRRIRLNKEDELIKLDSLVKARFVEMFGDLKFDTPVSKYIESLTAGKSLAGKEKCTNKVLNTGAVSYDKFKNDYKYLPSNYVPDENNKVRTGNVLISRMNTQELVGATAYVWEAPENTYLPDRLWRANLKENVNSIFLWQVLIHPLLKLQIQRVSSGTSGSMKNISKSNFLKLKVPDVNEESQNKFATFVQQVDKSKVVNASIMKYIISIRFYLYFKENKEGAR